MKAQYIGLTWDHPRGYDALARAERLINNTLPSPLIHWKKQPLEGFESAPIAQLAAEHDLLVLDHPHLGEAIATDCLIPLEAFYAPEQLETWSSACVGRSFQSYQMDGKSWALPLDVATQVVARRPDRIPEAPNSWSQILDLSESQPIALSLGGPHALLTLISIAAGYGYQPRGNELLPNEAFEQALKLMRGLYERQPGGTERLNPISLLETMADTNDIALIPLIFGYVTYSIPGIRENLLSFSNTMGLYEATEGKQGNLVQGGVLGGTGIAFTKRCVPTTELTEHIADLLSEFYQCSVFPDYGGQPSLSSAWSDTSVNRAASGFYEQTRLTAEKALVRPRFDGYIAFQTKAAEIIRDALTSGCSDSETTEQIRVVWQDARAGSRTHCTEPGPGQAHDAKTVTVETELD